MAYEHKPGTFAIFKNDKEGNEMRPDYTGEGADLNGKPIRVACWIKTGKKDKFLSCKFQIKDDKPETKKGGHFDDLEDDIPFN